MNLETAKIMAEAALKIAANAGATLSVSVVDESGRLVLCLRADGASFLSTQTSFAKAVAAAAFRVPTKLITELHNDNLAFWNNVAHASTGPILPSIGAVPIFANETCIGAVGCGGAKSGEHDHECAQAAVNAGKAYLMNNFGDKL